MKINFETQNIVLTNTKLLVAMVITDDVIIP